MKTLRWPYKALYYFCFACFGWAVRLLYPLRITGLAHLNQPGGYVLAPNHLFAIDPMYILLARGLRKKMLIMGKEELFRISPLLNFCWNVLGAFPVDRGKGDHSLIDETVAEVKRGRGLLIFPEGTRSPDGRLGRLKSGAFAVAQRADAPMVPCRISYDAGRPRLFRPIRVVFGPALTPRQLEMDGDYSPKKLRRAKAIFAMELEKLGVPVKKSFAPPQPSTNLTAPKADNEDV